MNSQEIRKSFLDFFKSKSHTIVDSASLMPTSPNLLFTNAGMNQFVPYFLGEQKSPFIRAADTQKCIRAGGKHNDLDDVGLDTYHQTFFEMLGNWSFGDYFKKEAINWAWELLTDVWHFPKERLYVTVYMPDESKGDPAEFDEEAYGYWKEIFDKENMDCKKHILTGDKKDNFWMMGETGPCGPCSEIHIDLTPNGDTNGSLVNQSSPYCIEIWNLVFMQFNACQDGSFVPLASKNIDTGMGFERVAGILATTKNFTDFSNLASNYNSDLFAEIFKAISDMSGKNYNATVPQNIADMSLEEMSDVVFRVIADHIRTLSFSIADGILPGNEGRNYVLRRILRRAVMYGKRLNLPSGFFAKLVPVVVKKMSSAFPELKENEDMIFKIISNEEKAFDRTLDRGLQLLDSITTNKNVISGKDAFVLYDTYGFPIDLTEIIAKERGIKLDIAGFEVQMKEQRERARASQKKEEITVQDSNVIERGTQFVGYDKQNWQNLETKLSAVIEKEDSDLLIFPQSPFYAQMGGQISDKGYVVIGEEKIEIIDCQKDIAGRFLHKVQKNKVDKSYIGKMVSLNINEDFRKSVQAHHSTTHILQWALRKVLGKHIKQAGSVVLDDKLRFDFTHFEAISKDKLKEIENLINSKILENCQINAYEVSRSDVPEDCIAFFGDKYGEDVRVVDMGFSKELCGGTHASSTGEIGFVKILSESAIATGTRRIEAIAGVSTLNHFDSLQEKVDKIASLLSVNKDKTLEKIEHILKEKNALEKKLKDLQKQSAGALIDDLIKSATKLDGEVKFVKAIIDIENPAELRPFAVDIAKNLGENSLVVLVGKINAGEKLSYLALSSNQAIKQGFLAGKIISSLAASLGGKGGGKPDMAMGGSQGVDNLEEVLNNLILK